MGRLDEYIVTARTLFGEVKRKTVVVVNASENITSVLTDWTLDKLEKGTNYSISVETSNGKFKGAAVETLMMTLATGQSVYRVEV